jgi:hypothetical protein
MARKKTRKKAVKKISSKRTKRVEKEEKGA